MPPGQSIVKTIAERLNLPELPKPGVSFKREPDANQFNQPEVAPPRAALPPAAISSIANHKRPRHKSFGLRWSALWLGTFCVFGGMGVAAYVWLTSLPPLPDCQKISPFSADAERLYCLRQAAASGDMTKLLEGLRLVSGWSANHPLHAETQELMTGWSNSILRLATQKLEAGDLKASVELAAQIPEKSPIYAEAQAAIATWQDQWQQGEKLQSLAQMALQRRDWNQASAQIPQLGKIENDYWRIKQLNNLTEQIIAERTAWETLLQARKLVKERQPEKLGEAIALVQQISTRSYTWTEAKANLEQWSHSLVNTSLERWQTGDLDGAVALAQQIPLNLATNSLAKNLIQFSHAHQLATQSNSAWEPSLEQSWRLLEAIATVRQIDPESPFYAHAQLSLKNWQQQIQDLTQLQFANLTASLGQRFTYKLAMDQAQVVGSDRPRRIQAQTLIAHWGQEIQRIEDRPYLAQAQKLAEPGGIPDLRQAIAVGSRIAAGRALWNEAQTLIARWTDQIEVIEDKPILAEAKALAQKGNLTGAIRTAAKIDGDRALYNEAQKAITGWRNQIRDIQIAEDRPILNEAYALAERERLTLAIETASQIGQGRALYNEAQAAIAEWRIRREAIWQQWEAESQAEGDNQEEFDTSTPDESGESDYSEENYSDESY